MTDVLLRETYTLDPNKLDDLTLIEHSTDEEIGKHLALRHSKGEMYTSIGDILVKH
jgi:hypothetical protein